MHTISRKTLKGKTLQFVGSAFIPLIPQTLQISIYRMASASFIICLSETMNPDLQGVLDGLGADVRGEAIAPYAQRHLEGITFQALQEHLISAYPKADFHWAREAASYGSLVWGTSSNRQG